MRHHWSTRTSPAHTGIREAPIYGVPSVDIGSRQRGRAHHATIVHTGTSAEEMASYAIPRFRGEMLSVTGVTNQPTNPAYAQTALGVQGRLGDSWQVGLRGNMQRFEDPIERHAELLQVAEKRFAQLKLHNLHTRHGDGWKGWPEAAPARHIPLGAGML